MHSNIQLIALDLDGTLYQQDGTISSFTKEQIKAAVKDGITVILSTGRPYVGLPLDDAKELGISYAITANGAAIYEIPSKTCMHEEGLPPKISVPILKSLLKFHLHLDAFVAGNAYTQESTRNIIQELSFPESLKNYIFSTRKVVPDICKYIEDNRLTLQKVTVNFVTREDGSCIDREAARQLLESYPQLKIVCGGFQNLEFTKAGISKAAGLHFLCKKLGISPENTMVCGDSENDLDIMQAAGLAIAMENATSEIKSIAHHVTASNNRDGVGLAIQKYALHI